MGQAPKDDDISVYLLYVIKALNVTEPQIKKCKLVKEILIGENK